MGNLLMDLTINRQRKALTNFEIAKSAYINLARTGAVRVRDAITRHLVHGLRIHIQLRPRHVHVGPRATTAVGERHLSISSSQGEARAFLQMCTGDGSRLARPSPLWRARQ